MTPRLGERFRRRLDLFLQQSLIENQVEPSVELSPDLRQVPDFREPQFLVQSHAGMVLAVDAGDHRVQSLRTRTVEQSAEQRYAEPSPADTRVEIDRVLDGVAITWPASKRPIRRIADDVVVAAGDEHRPSLRAPLFEPLRVHFRRALDLAEDRR